MTRTLIMCSWCHSLNPASERTCDDCGHELHHSRMECRCPQCERARLAARPVVADLLRGDRRLKEDA